MLHIGGDRPIFLAFERLDLALAIDDETQRDRLDTSSRLGTGQFAPQDRRKGETDKIIERAARPIGVDQILVQLARIRHCLEHGWLGDRVEGDAPDILWKDAPLPQYLLDMPADRLALAVGIGGEDQRVGILGLVGDRLQLAGFVGIGLPFHREAIVRIDRSILRGQVTDMAVGRQDAMTRSQIFLDGLGLGR